MHDLCFILSIRFDIHVLAQAKMGDTCGSVSVAARQEILEEVEIDENVAACKFRMTCGNGLFEGF